MNPENAQYSVYKQRLNMPEMSGQGMQAKIEKKRPIDEAMDQLNTHIDELNHALAQLEQKLNPYLIVEPPGTDSPTMPPAGCSLLAERIGKVTNDVSMATAYLRRLRERIE